MQEKHIFFSLILTKAEALALITQIQKKCQKGKSLEEIAEDLEKEIREIEAVYDIVRENPSRDREELLRMVLETDAALKKEAGRSSLYEYDEEKHMRQVREEGQMDGRNEGRSEGDADGKISLNQQKPSKHAGLRRFGPEKFLQRNNEFMKERPIFYKKPIKTEKDFSTWLRCFYYTTKAVITEYIYF